MFNMIAFSNRVIEINPNTGKFMFDNLPGLTDLAIFIVFLPRRFDDLHFPCWPKGSVIEFGNHANGSFDDN
jgi:hypothetical protein